MTHLNLFSRIDAARKRMSQCDFAPYVTPLEKSSRLTKALGRNVWLKLESEQRTGSFKYRGALNKMLSLSEQQRSRGIITASSGNHGFACALAAKNIGVSLTVYVPENASPVKCNNIEDLGATLIRVEGDCLQAEFKAIAAAKELKATFVSPYNDPEVIAGQGTIGLEIIEQHPQMDAVFIAVGGGGLMSGVGTAIKHLNPTTRMIACWPKVADAMAQCLEANQIVEAKEEQTISEATAGGIEPGSITLALCQNVIDEKVWVSEEDIKEAIKDSIEKDCRLVEGAAGVAIASAQHHPLEPTFNDLCIVVCGRNLSANYLRVIL